MVPPGRSGSGAASSAGAPPAAMTLRGRSGNPSQRGGSAATVNSTRTLHRESRMGTEYILTEDDKSAPDASVLEDLIELQLLTAGEPLGPVDFTHTQERHKL